MYTVQPVTIGMLFYPKWTLKKYTVAFVTNYYEAFDSVQVEALTVYQPPIPPRPEAHFISWYYDQHFMQPFNPSAPITGDITLYAKWVAKTVEVRVIIAGEVHGDFVFPYNTAVTVAQAHIEGVTGLTYKFYKNAALTQEVTVTRLTDAGYVFYAEEVEPADDEDDEDDDEPKPSWVESNQAYLIGGACVFAVIIAIAAIRKLF
jgi:uncharacterized repeat protein (TIGR02543 family)